MVSLIVDDWKQYNDSPISPKFVLQMEKSGCPDKEKKSRYKRRRPKNQLSDYSRRQKKHIWLESHLWHAKRMKMIDMWGYRLALHPNDKSVRAAHRAVKSSCLLQVLHFIMTVSYWIFTLFSSKCPLVTPKKAVVK